MQSRYPLVPCSETWSDVGLQLQSRYFWSTYGDRELCVLGLCESMSREMLGLDFFLYQQRQNLGVLVVTTLSAVPIFVRRTVVHIPELISLHSAGGHNCTRVIHCR